MQVDSEDVVEVIKIPIKRIAELRGDADSTINMLEKNLQIKIDADDEGTVDLQGASLNVFFALPVIRAIGRGFEPGKSKEIIEIEAECNLAIWGHTVGIVAPLEVLDIATNAVFKLIEGQPHAAVYLYLEKNKRRRKQDEIRDKAKMWDAQSTHKNVSKKE